MSNYGTYTGISVYSGYTPKNNIEKFDSDIIKSMAFIVDNGFTSVTIKHDENDIEISLINGDFHIDDVTGKYE